jgi:tetratricopeptide (TPR) repeat protein
MSRNFPTGAGLLSALHAAEDVWRRGAWSEALDAYAEILRGRLEDLADGGPAVSSMRAVDLVVVERLADLAVCFGLLGAADRLLQGYVALTSAAGNRLAADYAALKRVRLALGQGRWLEAVERLGEMAPSIGDVHAIRFETTALKRWEAERPWRTLDRDEQAVLFSRLYLELGRLLGCVGQYSDALAALERGLDHAGPEAPELARRALVPLEIAAIAVILERGELGAARARLDSLAQRPDFLDQPDAMLLRGQIAGKLALLAGDLGKALRLYADVLAECQSRGFRRAAVEAALNLAHLAITLNQTATARSMLNRALADAAGLDDAQGQLTARAAHLMALARARGTSLVDGVAIAPPVARLWGRGPALARAPNRDIGGPDVVTHAGNSRGDAPQATNYLAFFEDEALGFLSCLAEQGPHAAAARLDAIRAVFAATDSELIHLRLRALSGLSAYYLRRYDEAVASLDDAVAGFAALGLVPELWQALRVLGWCYQRIGRPRSEVEALAQRTQSLLDEMIRSLPAEDRPILLLNKWTSEEEFLAVQVDALVRERDGVEASPWLWRCWRRWALWKRLDELLLRLDRSLDLAHRRSVQSAAEPPQARVSRPTPLWRRMFLHPRRRAVVSFLVLPDRVFVACSRWGRLDFGVSAITRLEVRNHVRCWHEAVLRSDTASPEPARVAGELAAALQLPALLDRLPWHIRALTIVPDDSLHGFPFAAMNLGGTYLIERFGLSIGFERHPRQSPARRAHAIRPGAAPVEAFLVGVSRGSDAWEPLPGVVPELDCVARWLTARQIPYRRVEDDQADRTAVLAGLGRCSLAHLACHGVFEVDRPDASGLVLLPGPERTEVLSIRDLIFTDLTHLRQVAISACWSADNFVIPGRRVVSLPETFCRAGAHSVLGSLWPVDDAIAVALTGRFYEYLDFHPRDEALRRAQLDCLQGRLLDDRDAFTTNPVAWAGFTLSGDPGRLRL